MKKVSSYYDDKLTAVRQEIIDSIRNIMERLGGTVSFQHYEAYEDVYAYNFFQSDLDGYAVRLTIDSITEDGDGDYAVTLRDSEDIYNPVNCLRDFNASESLYILMELEDIAEVIETSGKPVVTEYDPDYED